MGGCNAPSALHVLVVSMRQGLKASNGKYVSQSSTYASIGMDAHRRGGKLLYKPLDAIMGPLMLEGQLIQ